MATVTTVSRVTKAEYDAKIKEIGTAESLKSATDSLAQHEKNVADGTELLQKLRAQHLVLVESGTFGADAIQYGINELASELRYQRDYVNSAKRTVDRLKGNQPSDETPEF